MGYLISLGVLVIWGICGRLAHVREKDFRLWRYYVSLGPYKAWEEDKNMMGFICYLLGPISLLMVYSMSRTNGFLIRDTLQTKSFGTSTDRKAYYEKNIEIPYYEKYKIDPCDFCSNRECGIDVYNRYHPCKRFIEAVKISKDSKVGKSLF